MKVLAKDRTESIEILRALLPVGATIHTQLVHVSRSGMTRLLRLFIIENGDLRNITWHVANALNERTPDYHGDRVLKMDGCGTDMGFQAVYCLGHALYPSGFGVEGVGRNGDRSGRDSDGGYSLKQRWI